MAVVVRRFGVYLVSLDPTVGAEVPKTRPALVVSPDEMNAAIATVIVAPMTTRGRAYPGRVPCAFECPHAGMAAGEYCRSMPSRSMCVMRSAYARTTRPSSTTALPSTRMVVRGLQKSMFKELAFCPPM